MSIRLPEGNFIGIHRYEFENDQVSIRPTHLRGQWVKSSHRNSFEDQAFVDGILGGMPNCLLHNYRFIRYLVKIVYSGK